MLKLYLSDVSRMEYEKQAVERRRSSMELVLGSDPRYANGGGDAAQYESTATYFDEEDLLGFKIWVAELELLVGKSKRNYKEDAGACYRLLQKLNATLDRTAVSEMKEYQRRCEDALVDILLRGMPPPVSSGAVKDGRLSCSLSHKVVNLQSVSCIFLSCVYKLGKTLDTVRRSGDLFAQV